MWRLYDLAEKEIPTFGGIYFADSKFDHALETLRTDRTVILGSGQTVLGALTLGFVAISHPMINIFPEWFVELYDHVRNYRLKEAIVVQDKIFKRIRDTFTHDEDLIVKSKTVFNTLNLGFKVGATRKPVWTQSMFRQY